MGVLGSDPVIRSMDQGENEDRWMNEVTDNTDDDESFIEIQINKTATGMSISSSSSSSSPSPNNDHMHTTRILSSASNCFSAYNSMMRLVMKLGCSSVIGVIKEKVNVGEKWVLQVIHRRRSKSSLKLYNNNEEALTDDSLQAAIAYCNHSSLKT